MGKFNILIMRIIMGCVIAVVLARVFHPEFNFVYVIGFAIFLISMAYILEAWRSRRNKK